MAHHVAGWTAEKVQEGTEEREWGNDICPFAVCTFYLSRPTISLVGLKKVTVGLYPVLDSCCRQISLQIQVQNDEICLCNFVTNLRLLCHGLLFPCIYKDRLEEIPHFW